MEMSVTTLHYVTFIELDTFISFFMTLVQNAGQIGVRKMITKNCKFLGLLSSQFQTVWLFGYEHKALCNTCICRWNSRLYCTKIVYITLYTFYFYKQQFYLQIRSCAEKYDRIFTFCVTNMRNIHMKDIRNKWNHSRYVTVFWQITWHTVIIIIIIMKYLSSANLWYTPELSTLQKNKTTKNKWKKHLD